MVTYSIAQVGKFDKEQVHSPLAFSIISTSMMIILEISNYSSYRAKAFLFLQLKAQEDQSQQLNDLLDAVPDSVFICSKSKDTKMIEHKAMYSNLKMSNFFGRDPVQA